MPNPNELPTVNLESNLIVCKRAINRVPIRECRKCCDQKVLRDNLSELYIFVQTDAVRCDQRVGTLTETSQQWP